MTDSSSEPASAAPDHSVSADLGSRLSTHIVGTGSSLPSRTLLNEDLTEFLDTSDSWIQERVGIRSRNICSEEETGVSLAENAARKAIHTAGVTCEDIDVIIFATFTADQELPSASALLAEKLGIHRSFAFDLNAACSGFLFAFVTAESLLQTMGLKTALIVGADTLSRAVDWRDRNTATLFGDGAGAAVIVRPDNSQGSCIIGSHLSTLSEGAGLITQATVTERTFQAPAVKPKLKESLNPYLQMQGRSVFKNGVHLMEESILRVLADAKLTIDDVSLFIPHQSNIRMINAVCSNIGIDNSRVATNIDRVGNTSAASIPIVLNESVESERLNRGDLLLMTSVGSGMTYGSVLVEY